MTYSYDFTRKAADQYVGVSENPKNGALTHFFGPDSKARIQAELKKVQADYDDVTTLIPVEKAWVRLFAGGRVPPKHRWFSRMPEKDRQRVELFYAILISQQKDEEEKKTLSYEFAESLRKDWANVSYRYQGDGMGEGKAKLPYMEVSFRDSGNESAVVMSLSFTTTGGIHKTPDAKKAAKLLKQISKLVGDLNG